MSALLTVGADLSRVMIAANLPSGTTFTETKVVAYGQSNDCKIEEGISGGTSYVKIITPSGEKTLYDGSDNYTLSAYPDFGTVTSVDEDAVSYPYLIRESDKRIYGLTEDKNLKEIEFEGAGFHNSIYRGKNLGSTVTYAQAEAIKNGDFSGLFIGDYWEKPGKYVDAMQWDENSTVKWIIAGFDYYFGAGSSGYLAVTQHHIVLIPEDVLYDIRMNASESTSGGYRNSEMFASGLGNATSTANRHFNYTQNEGKSALFMRPQMATTVVTDGRPTDAMKLQSTVSLLTEGNVFGSPQLAPIANGENVEGFLSFDYMQLPLFRLNPAMIHIQEDYWLRDIYDDTSYCMVDSDGRPNKDAADEAHGVRPIIAVYAF